MTEHIPLSDMQAGEKGTVVEIVGGWGVHSRLRVLGIRPRVKITKVSAVFMRGPVVLQVAGAQIALGFGVSHKVIVEVKR